MLGEEDEVFLENEEEGTVEVSSPKRMSAALRFSRRVIERTPTYDEMIEGTSKVAFPEDMDLELDIPWQDRFFQAKDEDDSDLSKDLSDFRVFLRDQEVQVAGCRWNFFHFSFVGRVLR